eukprot:299495-Rhodomonas_salina.1
MPQRCECCHTFSFFRSNEGGSSNLGALPEKNLSIVVKTRRTEDASFGGRLRRILSVCSSAMR